MTVLLTGVTGLVGSAIARRLLNANFEVHVLIRKNADTCLIDDILPKLHNIEGDILDVLGLEHAFENIEYVIHAAAMVSFGPKDAEKLHAINVEGTANMVNAALHKNVKKFCYISSVATLGRPSSAWTSSIEETIINESQKWEDSDLNSNYAKSKYLAENEVWRAAAEGLNVIVLNPSIILGEGNWHKSSTQMFKYVYDQKPFVTQGYINFVDVSDLAEICVQMLTSKTENERFIVSAGKVSLIDFFAKIAKEFNKKAPHILLNSTIIEILWRLEAFKSFFTKKTPLITKETAKTAQLNILYDASKIKKELDYQFIDLDHSIARICSYLEKNIPE